MTSLQGSTGGPLPTYKLLNLFLEIANEHNNKVLMDIFNEKISTKINIDFILILQITVSNMLFFI